MSTKFSSLSPIDGAVIWSGESSSPEQIESTMRLASEAAASWRTTSLAERTELVCRYGQYLEDHRQEIADLIRREVGKLPWDANGEVSAAIAKIPLSINAHRQRSGRQVLEEGAVGRVIRYQPIGVALVLGPFNFPLHLPGGQIIPALLAGNSVVFKPSEQATAIGQWMCDAWRKVGLPEGVLQLITGGVETAAKAIDAPQVGGVFLTGSRAAGRAIHRQLAGRFDVLLALELGGNNPIVVCDGEPAAVASLVSFSAFISSGQRCTCARRALFVEGPRTQDQIDALVQTTQALRVGMPGDVPAAQVGPLISVAAAESLRHSYEQLIEIGCHPFVPMVEQPRPENLIRPTILEASSLSKAQLRKLGDMEWFGPMLVVQRVTDFDEAIRAASGTPYGLAASLLGGSQEMFDRFVAEVGAGVVNWNRPTTGAAGALPFGGRGESGNHRPAGFFAIDFCGDPVASLESATLPEDDPWDIVR